MANRVFEHKETHFSNIIPSKTDLVDEDELSIFSLVYGSHSVRVSLIW
jgi:hypothetical protein